MILKSNILFRLILSSLLLGITQSYTNYGWLAWFGFIPVFKILEETTNKKNIFLFGYIWGLLYHLSSLFWIAFNIGTTPMIAFLSMIGTVLYLSLFPGVTFLTYNFLFSHKKHNLLIFPSLWVVFESLKVYGPLSFPWSNLANTQTDFFYLIQNAEYIGINGICFWLLLINSVFYVLIKKSYRKKHVIIYVLVFFIPHVSGFILFKNHTIDLDNQISIASIQPNISLMEKRALTSHSEKVNKLIDLSQSFIDSNYNLIVWPESIVSMKIFKNTQFLERMNLQNNTMLLSGIFYRDYDKGIWNNYNSIINLSNLNDKLYHKIKLVPFAEYIPMNEYFPDLKKINFGQANFEIGSEYKLFELEKHYIAGMVCIESTYYNLSRHFVNEGANMIVYVINDGWYTTPPEPQQHAKQSIFRAIETRRPVVRCTNTGISMIINQFGEVIDQLELNKEGIISSKEVYLDEKITFYVKFGEWIVILSILYLISQFVGIFYAQKN